MKWVSLDKDYSIKLKSKVVSFLNPDYIYLPVFKNTLESVKVLKGDLIEDGVYSPVSGIIINTKDCIDCYNKKYHCLVIENNFKEKEKTLKASRKKIDILDKEYFLNSILEDRLRNKFNQKINELIIYGINDEPYIATEVFIQKENTKIILETIDTILHIFDTPKARIIIKNIDSENILSYQNFIGTYKNISLQLINDVYLFDNPEFLKKYIHASDEDLILKASEIYDIYNYIKKQKELCEKYITISGNAISNPLVFNVKIGTSIMEILDKYFDVDVNKFDVYVNGLMSGKKVNVQDLIVTKDMQGILIMQKEEKKERNCINCGKCLDICPISSNPKMALLEDKKVPCINCGLCSYICPSYINLRKYLGGEDIE